jgi:RNA recognition motif-containing protein
MTPLDVCAGRSGVEALPMNHTRVYLGDLSPTLTEETLRELLAEVGGIIDIAVTEPTPLRVQRFAIIELENSELARQAVKLFNGRVVDGYRLLVYTLPPKTKPRDRS